MVNVRDRILRLLEDIPGGVMQSYIHRALGVSKSRVSEIVRMLEDEGLVVRIRVGSQYLVRLSSSPSTVKPPKGKIRLGLVWSSEYPFITPFAKLLERRLGIRLVVRVYPSAIEATQALLRGEVELALSPLVTQFYSSMISGGEVRILGGGAYGGGVVLERSEAWGGIASSRLSTMDLCRAMALKEGIIEEGQARYFDEPWEAVRLAALGKPRYIVAWHPLFVKLYRYGYKPLVGCDELGAKYCCTLASTTRVPRSLLEKISAVYSEAISEFKRKPYTWIEWYSAEVGIPSDLVKDGLKYYGFRDEIHVDLVEDTLKKAGIRIPDPSISVRRIILQS